MTIREDADKIIKFCREEGMDLSDAGTACSFAGRGFLHRMNIIMNEDAEDTETAANAAIKLEK